MKMLIFRYSCQITQNCFAFYQIFRHFLVYFMNIRFYYCRLGSLVLSPLRCALFQMQCICPKISIFTSNQHKCRVQSFSAIVLVGVSHVIAFVVVVVIYFYSGLKSQHYAESCNSWSWSQFKRLLFTFTWYDYYSICISVTCELSAFGRRRSKPKSEYINQNWVQYLQTEEYFALSVYSVIHTITVYLNCRTFNKCVRVLDDTIFCGYN